MPFSFVNSKGKKYFLHKKEKLYFFSQKEKDAIELPEGYKVIENIRTGLPMLKKEK